MVVSNRHDSRILNSGYHFLNPFFDQVRYYNWSFLCDVCDVQGCPELKTMEGHLIPTNSFQVDPPIFEFKVVDPIAGYYSQLIQMGFSPRDIVVLERFVKLCFKIHKNLFSRYPIM
jgi:hypothetical protein